MLNKYLVSAVLLSTTLSFVVMLVTCFWLGIIVGMVLGLQGGIIAAILEERCEAL